MLVSRSRFQSSLPVESCRTWTVGFFLKLSSAFPRRPLDQNDRDQIVIRIDRELHDIALDLFALPQSRAGKQIDCLEPRLAALVAGEQDQVGVGYRRDRCLVDLAGRLSPNAFAGQPVDGVQALFRSGKNDAEIGRLIKADFRVEIRLPRRLGEGTGREEGSKRTEIKLELSCCNIR